MGRIKQIDNKTENAILEAAEIEFLTKGYTGARTIDIANAAGVSHTMLHYYYRTKENIFNKIYQEKVKLLRESITSLIFCEDLTLLERIEKGIEIHFDFLVKNPSLPRFLINEVITNPKRLEIFKSTIKNAAEDIINKLQTELDNEEAKKNICKIKAVDLVIDIISLNLFMFIMYPIAEAVLSPLYGGIESMIQQRKKENVKTILSRLKPL